MALLQGPKHIVELANPGCKRLIGGRPIIGLSIAEAIPEAAAQGYVQLLDDVYRSGKAFSASGQRFVNASGANAGIDLYVDFAFQPITDTAGAVSGIFIEGVDVTHNAAAAKALRAAQEGLLRSEEQLRLATEAAEVGTWDVDPVTDTLFWQDRVKAMFGISTGVAVTMNDIYDGLHPEDRPRTAAAYAAAADPAMQSVYDVEYRTIGKEDGIVRWVAAKGRGIFDDAGRCVRVIGTATDITHRKSVETSLQESEQRLREADRRKDVFLATLAHEIRNPLAPFGNSLTLLRRSRTDEAAFSRIVSILDRQLAQLVRLTDDLLDSSRFSMGKLTLRLEPVWLNDILTEAADAFRPSVAASGQRLELNLPERAIAVRGDATRLLQAFGNLIGNASKFTPDGGSIRVSARETGSSATVAIRDTGVGLAGDELAVIFEVFSQLGSPLERPNNGLGIGLSLARQLVEMHGGSLTAHSEGRGGGSEFVVELPLSAHAATSLRQTPTAERSPSLPSLATRILIVDDNEDSTATLAMLLETLGHETSVANSGARAIELAGATRPHAMFLDLGMPGMSGYDVCRLIRAQPWSSEIRIVALSGWGQAEDRRLSAMAGFDSHLVKPAALKDLQAEIEKSRPQPSVKRPPGL